MNAILRRDADSIISSAIMAVLPGEAVRGALKGREFGGRVILIAAGKAAWTMARAAQEALGERIEGGVVISKYGHITAPLEGLSCFEAGHPLPDDNSFRATRAALNAVSGLESGDTVLFLLSGGGSALFEQPLIPPQELRYINEQLLASGADIVEINTIRKRLSGVKGGRFALKCAPARVFSIILSDVLGDPPDMIASGPACPDSSTAREAREIARRYALDLSAGARALLDAETPKAIENAETHITGSVRLLCAAAAGAAQALGYAPVLLTDRLNCQAREAGSFLASIARTHSVDGRAQAYIAGGETVVRLSGSGRGGRNQELALAAAPGLDGLNACVFSAGSDGSDGPTDAAGGYSDGETAGVLRAAGINIQDSLNNNDSYNALRLADGLIFTGPTGTNVNDVAVALIRPN